MTPLSRGYDLYYGMLESLTPKSKRPKIHRNKKNASRAKRVAAKNSRRRNRN